MKRYLAASLLMFSLGTSVYAEETLPSESLDSKIETILNNSNLSLSEKTQVQTLAFQEIERKKNRHKTNLKEMDSRLIEFQNKAQKYTAFTSALGVKFLEMASEAGVTVDNFIKESWIGKFALISTFLYFGGSHLVHIFIMIGLAFFISYSMRKLIFYIGYENLRFKPEDYQIIKVKRSWLGRILCKSPVKEKRIPLVNYLSNSHSEGIGGLGVTYIFAVAITPALFGIFSFFLFF